MGSSPLTQGKHQADRTRRRKDGLIPAHAGKTERLPDRRGPGRAHPRSRRENHLMPQPIDLSAGSSPLTRGKRYISGGKIEALGLIPTHTGRAFRAISILCPEWVQLRSRGENHMPSDNGMSYSGSSPLTRGKQEGSARRIRPGRLIPTHAGKTLPKPLIRTSSPDHPHSREDNVVSATLPVGSPGSSPLTRGKRRACRSVNPL